MFIHLKDSTINLTQVSALTKGVVTLEDNTYFTMCVYVVGSLQPLVHTYESEQERDETFEEFKEALNAYCR